MLVQMPRTEGKEEDANEAEEMTDDRREFRTTNPRPSQFPYPFNRITRDILLSPITHWELHETIAFFKIDL